MNARQTKKNLKRKIHKLESDNNLMKRIIEDHSEMLELYNLYNSPKLITHQTMRFVKYRAEHIVPLYCSNMDDEHLIERVKSLLVEGMHDAVQENTIFDVDRNYMGVRRVRATLYLGRKDDLDNEGEDI